MSRFPLPAGQINTGVGGQLPAPALAPGREIVQVVQKLLPDGRTLQFVYIQRTFATPDRTFVTHDLVRGPTLDCSCSVLAPVDVYCCFACSAAVCARHCATCAACGLIHCSACSVGIVNGGMRAIVCGRCAKSLRAGLIVRVFRSVSRWLWE